MAQARLQITKDNVTGYLLIGIGRDHTWRLEGPVPWVDGTQGTWARRTNATKFRQFTFIELCNAAGKGVIRMQDFPYKLLDKFQGDLVSHLWIFEAPGAAFDVLVVAAPPPTKRFRIRESWAGALSVVVAQTEVCGFEILDTTTNQSQSYLYKGIGISFGPPIKKLPSVMPGASSSGPWNDFDAPGWMTEKDFSGDATLQTFYNVGLGTDKSRNAFDFAGNVDGNPGFLVHLDNLSTGRTFSLPSAGFSSGSMNVPEASPTRGLRKGEI
jgi:hypothetical protein